MTAATAEAAELERLFARMKSTWRAGDAIAYADCFTADVDYISFDGTHHTGRTALIEHMDELFRGVLFGSELVGEVEAVRMVTPDVAMVHANGSVLMAWRRSLPRRRLSRQTLVAVRTAEGWRFTAFHNTRIRPRPVPQPNAFPSKASRALTRLARRAGVPQRRRTELIQLPG